jgi:hypothetical protein
MYVIFNLGVIMTTATKATRCEASKLRKGTKFSRISYGEIVGIYRREITVRNEAGTTWTISPDIVEDEFYTPDQFTEVKEVNRTEMVQAIVSNPRIVMRVTFKKKPDPKDLKSAVGQLLDDVEAGGKRPGVRKLASILKEATEGQTRVMIGRHSGALDEFGRLQFTDMEVTKGHNLRQVDPRTVEEAIVAGIKFVLK